MKNKKLLLKLVLAIMVVAIMFISKPINVHADDIDGSSNGNYRLVLSTRIDNWDPDYRFNNFTLYTSDTSGTINLGENNSGLTLDYNVNFYLSSNDQYDSDDDLSISSGDLSSDNFVSGSKVYLLEVYDFDIPSGYALDNKELSFELPLNSYIYTNITNNDLNRAMMSNYQGSTNTVTAYIDGVYDGEDVSESRGFYDMIYFKDESDSKTDTKSRGSVFNPKFYVSFSGTKKGNLLPNGDFDVRSGLDGPEQVSYSGFIEFANATITYSGEDSGYYNVENKSHSFEETQYGYGFNDNTNLSSASNVRAEGNSYTVFREFNVENYKDSPTGIFYNVLPFVVAIIVAGAGVVLLKKNSIQ